jgi:hypothetical protein
VPEIDLVQANQTFMPSFPADYGEGSNLVTITNEPYISDVPIVADDLDNTSIFQDIELPEGPPITVNLNQSYPSDNYSPAPQYGFDEAAVDAYDFITSGNTGNANSGIVQAVVQPETTSGYAGNIIVNPYTIDMSPSEIAYQDAIANPVVETPVVTPQILPSFINEDSGDQEGQEMYQMFKEGLLADDMMIGSNYLGIDDNPKPAPAPVSIPSIFRPRPTPAPTVFASPGGAPGFTSYGPPNLQLVGGR